MNAFSKYVADAYPYEYEGTLHVHQIQGGTPSNDNVAKAWLATKLAAPDDIIREQVAQIMVERGITADEAAAELDTLKHLNGFKRDENGLYIEGRQLKACIKEAASVAMSVQKLPRKWGATNKGIKSFVAEHICVVEDRLPLGVTEPTGITQRFVSTFRGTGIQYEEYVEDAKIDFTIRSDYDFSEKEWAMLWLTAGEQGIGASRSQGFGRFDVAKWERVR